MSSTRDTLHNLIPTSSFEKLMVAESVIVQQKKDYQKLLNQLDEANQTIESLKAQIRPLQVKIKNQREMLVNASKTQAGVTRVNLELKKKLAELSKT